MKHKWFVRIGVVLVGTLLLTAFGIVADWKVTRSRNEERLRAAVEKLDAEDPGWRTHDLNNARNAALPPADRNAGEQMLVALGLAPPSFTGWAKEDKFRAEPVSNHLMDAAAFRAAAAVHAECAAALDVARRVRSLPDGGFAIRVAEPNPLETRLDNTQKMRNGASLLGLDAIVQAYNQRPAEALQSCHAILNLASGAIGDEPTLISQLARIFVTLGAVNEVERTLAWNEVPTGLAEFQARLAAERDVPRMRYGLRGDRANLDRVFENLDSGVLTPTGLVGNPASAGWGDGLAFRYLRKVIPDARAYTLEHFNVLVASTQLADPERIAVVEATVAKIPRLSTVPAEDRFKFLLLPASNKVNDAESRVRARLGCAVAALACERFRQKTGRWPAALGDIPPDLLAAVPVDPYTGRPLLYRVHAEGVTVYATGSDKTDDGGTAISPNGRPGTDLGFRLWNCGLRRAAPVPIPDPADGPE